MQCLELSPSIEYTVPYTAQPSVACWLLFNKYLQALIPPFAELCCRRAQLADGQDILELGCGWGSMCLYAAAKYPGSQVTAVSNSKTQKKFIDEQCKQRGIKNLTVSFSVVLTHVQSLHNCHQVDPVEMQAPWQRGLSTAVLDSRVWTSRLQGMESTTVHLWTGGVMDCQTRRTMLVS